MIGRALGSNVPQCLTRDTAVFVQTCHFQDVIGAKQVLNLLQSLSMVNDSTHTASIYGELGIIGS